MRRLFSYLFAITIFRTSSSFNKDIVVRLIDGAPALVVNHVIQSGTGFTRIWRKVFKHFDLSRHSRPSASLRLNPGGNLAIKNIAVIGVGGGDVLHLLRDEFPLAHITAVDIDEKVIHIAKEYFGLNEMKNIALVVQDAQDFVKKQKTYDLIVLDLYIGNDIPPFLASRAFLTDVKKRLSAQGAVVVNFLKASEGASNGGFEMVARSIFSSVSSFDIAYNRFFLART